VITVDTNAIVATEDLVVVDNVIVETVNVKRRIN